MKKLIVSDIIKEEYIDRIDELGRKLDFDNESVKDILNQSKKDQEHILSLKNVPIEEYMKVVNI